MISGELQPLQRVWINTNHPAFAVVRCSGKYVLEARVIQWTSSEVALACPEARVFVAPRQYIYATMKEAMDADS